MKPEFHALPFTVGSTLLTTEALVTDIKEPQPMMAPPAGGMDY